DGLRPRDLRDQLGAAERREAVVGELRLAHAHSEITVRDCSRRACITWDGAPPALPVVPEPFQPPNGWTPGHAPVVAPARRFTYTTPAWILSRHSSISSRS